MPVHDVDVTAWNTPGGEATSTAAAAFANGQSNFDASGSVIMPPHTASDR